MKFKDMSYERIDIEKTRSDIDHLISNFSKAADFAEADSIFMKVETISSHIDTMFSVANVRHEINTLDEFYRNEIEFIDESTPILEEKTQEWAEACIKSEFRAQLEEKYGKLFFRNIELRLKTFSPEIIPELQEENQLTTEYTRLIASAQIPFENGIYTISQLMPYKQDTNDERRLAAWRAEGGFYRENKEKLDEIYDKLVSLRDKMAKKLGYRNFVELGYYRMNRNCYGTEDIKKFRNAVIKYLVPVAEEIFKAQAKRTGFSYPLNFSEAALTFRSGNPKPKGSANDILEQGRRFYKELSEETSEFINFMYENELLDVLSRKGKAGGGFCTSFPDYKSPFIFANFNGTADDVEVITHEASHAFAAYSCRDIEPISSQQPTLEACEVHSMTMEFFAWPWAEGFFGDDTDKFYYKHLSGALTFIPYGTMVDHFQHEIYENPDMAPGERDELWKALLKTYNPWIKLGEIPFYGDGHGWQRQSHIYQVPFYYIDYCLAQTVALQFWAIMQKDINEAFRRYLALVKLGGTNTFSELTASAGLKTPFNENALNSFAEEAVVWLNNADKSKL